MECQPIPDLIKQVGYKNLHLLDSPSSCQQWMYRCHIRGTFITDMITFGCMNHIKVTVWVTNNSSSLCVCCHISFFLLFFWGLHYCIPNQHFYLTKKERLLWILLTSEIHRPTKNCFFFFSTHKQQITHFLGVFRLGLLKRTQTAD